MKPSGFVGSVSAQYHVLLYSTTAAAVSANAYMEKTLSGALSPVGIQNYDFSWSSLARPELHAWVFFLPNIHCNAEGGFTYRNIVVLMGVSSQDDDGFCNSKSVWVTKFGSQILSDASSYHAEYESERSASIQGLQSLLRHSLVSAASMKRFARDWYAHGGAATVNAKSGTITTEWRTYDFYGPGAPYPCDAMENGISLGFQITVRIYRIAGNTAHGHIIATTASRSLPLGNRADFTLGPHGTLVLHIPRTILDNWQLCSSSSPGGYCGA